MNVEGGSPHTELTRPFDGQCLTAIQMGLRRHDSRGALQAFLVFDPHQRSKRGAACHPPPSCSHDFSQLASDWAH